MRQAIESVLAQSFTDFEFIIVDDCSTDDSVAIIESFRDPRLRLLRAPERLRICKALNLGLDHAKGRYVARMDADDVCRPTRLNRQVRHMDRHPGVALCGSWVRRFGYDDTGRVVKGPTAGDDVRAHALFDNPIVHSSVMIQRDVLETTAMRYEEAYRNAEDYELWIRLFAHGRAVNLPEVLLDYRVHPQSVTTAAGAGMDEAASRVVRRLLSELGMNPADDEVLFHRHLGTGRLRPERDRSALARAAEWLEGLIACNDRTPVYAPRALRRAVADVWYRACYPFLSEDPWLVRRYLPFWRSVCRCAHPAGATIFLGAAIKSQCRRATGLDREQ